ncbi:MAG: hypothetical protein JSW04_11575 [Desulfobacterales bacterium]|nr:MAG: hypothetical protein JSW04_11575 [Desulfobacterales bacterium]
MNPFKTCPKCAFTWTSSDDFLDDPAICLVGFQANFIETDSALYLFNHILEDNRCNTTMAVEVDNFLFLNKETLFEEIKFGSSMCESHCRNVEDLSECPAECKNAIARKIMQDFSHCNG